MVLDPVGRGRGVWRATGTNVRQRRCLVGFEGKLRFRYQLIKRLLTSLEKQEERENYIHTPSSPKSLKNLISISCLDLSIGMPLHTEQSSVFVNIISDSCNIHADV